MRAVWCQVPNNTRFPFFIQQPSPNASSIQVLRILQYTRVPALSMQSSERLRQILTANYNPEDKGAKEAARAQKRECFWEGFPEQIFELDFKR